jgi:hypothetical protein
MNFSLEICLCDTFMFPFAWLEKEETSQALPKKGRKNEV